MHSLFAFHTQLATGPVTYSNLAPVADPITTVVGNLMYVTNFVNLIGGYALGTGASKSKIETPSILNLAPFSVDPVDAASTPSSPTPIKLQPGDPIKLVQDEALQFFGSNSSTAGPQDEYGVVILSDGALAPVNGNIVTARATLTTGSTANVWVNAALSFETVLPQGSYDVVGMRAEGAHTYFARLVFQGNTLARPGVICQASDAKVDIPEFRRGAMGKWGTFNAFTPPSVDTFGDGTSETLNVILDLIKTP